MSGRTVWYFVKIFSEESHADQFLAGSLYLNPLGYFKRVEGECGDGRMDTTEAVALWWQPDDLDVKLTGPGGGVQITASELAGPVSIAFDHFNSVRLLCLYTVYTTGFECVDGEISLTAESADELRRQLRIDERMLKFGNFAVIVHASSFIRQTREALMGQGISAIGRLVEYYDDAIFHGTIPPRDIPFRKQRRFSYQREYRLCVYHDARDDTAIRIDIGDLSRCATKVDAAQLNTIFERGFRP